MSVTGARFTLNSEGHRGESQDNFAQGVSVAAPLGGVQAVTLNVAVTLLMVTSAG